MPSAAVLVDADNAAQVLNSEDRDVRRNMERLKQVTVGEMRTVRALTSSALRSKLRLSGKDKRGRVFLPG